MTIDWLHVDLKDCFAPGQAYVACSRGRSTDSMTIDNFNLHEVKTSDTVKRFYDCLKKGKIYSESLWSDNLDKFDEQVRKEFADKLQLFESYKHKKCVCGSSLEIRKVQTNRSGNIGKWSVRCSKEYGKSHTFDFVT